MKRDCTEIRKAVPDLGLILKSVQNLDLEPTTNWETTDLVTGRDGTVTAPCYFPVVTML